MKIFTFKAQDGSVWGFPATIVAHHRAEYYAKQDPDTTYHDEFSYTMSDNSELMDWVMNNMDFADLHDHLIKIRPAVPIDLEKAWNKVGGDEIGLRDAGPDERLFPFASIHFKPTVKI